MYRRIPAALHCRCCWLQFIIIFRFNQLFQPTSIEALLDKDEIRFLSPFKRQSFAPKPKPFKRLRGTTKPEGVGLGLAMAYGIVEQVLMAKSFFDPA